MNHLFMSYQKGTLILTQYSFLDTSTQETMIHLVPVV